MSLQGGRLFFEAPSEAPISRFARVERVRQPAAGRKDSQSPAPFKPKLRNWGVLLVLVVVLGNPSGSRLSDG